MKRPKSPLKKGRFIIQEVDEVHEKKTAKNPRHESISQSKKIIMITHYNKQTSFNPIATNDYSSLVYDNYSEQWINFDKIWYNRTINKTNDCSFGKIFQYFSDNTEEEYSHVKSNEDASTKASTEKGIFKENGIKKPKSLSCLYQADNDKCRNDEFLCVSNENIQYNGRNHNDIERWTRIPLVIVTENNFYLE